ncbi:MAG: SDR family NAD(P)-dependent oxidoreductase [Hyphomicrobiaceae bacterium]
MDRREQGARRKSAIVTGASRGIGRAIAERLARRGYDVLLVARTSTDLERAAAELRRRLPADQIVAACAVDLASTDAAAVIMTALHAHGLRADVLVNNAGVGLGGPFIDHDAVDIERLVAVNISAVTRLTHGFAQAMAASGGGSIVNISSLGAFVPGPNQALYYASNAYVQSLSEAIASELAGQGVHVGVVAPGPVRTTIHATMGGENALYRWLIPSMSPESIARSVDWCLRLRRRVVVPGLHNWALSWVLRVLPHRISVPLVGRLLAPR